MGSSFPFVATYLAPVEIAAQVVDLEGSNGDRDFEFVLAKSRLGRNTK